MQLFLARPGSLLIAATALMALEKNQTTIRDIVTDAAVRNAMVVFAAFGGSTNLLLHLPAIAHAAGLRRPTARDWADVNHQVPRTVDALPNGPRNHPTVERTALRASLG